jgi:hypothetical protein
MTIPSEVAAQLDDELVAAVCPLAVLVGPNESVMWPETLAGRAELLAGQLCQDDDDRLAAQTVIDIMAALWRHGAPEQVGRADWWRTPLGRMCARSLGRDDSDAVSYSVAASMLGVTSGTTKQLTHRGSLERHPDGGITRASVLARLVRLD